MFDVSRFFVRSSVSCNLTRERCSRASRNSPRLERLHSADRYWGRRREEREEGLVRGTGQPRQGGGGGGGGERFSNLLHRENSEGQEVGVRGFRWLPV